MLELAPKTALPPATAVRNRQRHPASDRGACWGDGARSARGRELSNEPERRRDGPVPNLGRQEQRGLRRLSRRCSPALHRRRRPGNGPWPSSGVAWRDWRSTRRSGTGASLRPSTSETPLLPQGTRGTASPCSSRAGPLPALAFAVRFKTALCRRSTLCTTPTGVFELDVGLARFILAEERLNHFNYKK